ncbi:MAG: hypothetical protein AB201_03125 [Parcubacteria bacterium C7867-006]|nr:MAG: hypothetical protein AB201_03125 [Parcubacteria bacterium C7867-006]
MQLSPEVRARKIREIAERHGWTIQQTEDQIKHYRTRVVDSEAALLDALVNMKPEDIRQSW